MMLAGAGIELAFRSARPAKDRDGAGYARSTWSAIAQLEDVSRSRTTMRSRAADSTPAGGARSDESEAD